LNKEAAKLAFSGPNGACQFCVNAIFLTGLLTYVRDCRTLNIFVGRYSMTTVSVNQFRDNLRHYTDLATKNHEPVTVTRRNGGDFVVIGVDDWLSLEETLYVLQNKSLMQQIATSIKTHKKGKGRPLSSEELNEINRI
jgi:antitoxin YefM